MINELISNFISIHPLLFHSIIALISLAIVAKSADLLVYGISDYARKLGISDYLIGFLIVSIGTALPELIASINAALLKQGGIVFGTVLGSNIFKIPLLGLILLIGKKIKTNPTALGNAPVTTLILAAMPVLLIIDGSLSRTDGIILLIAFFMYVGRLWQGEGQLGKIKKTIAVKNIYKDAIIFLGTLTALLLGARWLVSSSLQIAKTLSISPYIVGLVVIGIGASTPELTVQIRSIFKHHQDLAFGNVLGSIVANSTLVLGLTALIAPFFMNIKTVMITFIFMIAGTVFALLLMEKEEVNWKQGLVLVAIYVIFLIVELVF